MKPSLTLLVAAAVLQLHALSQPLKAADADFVYLLDRDHVNAWKMCGRGKMNHDSNGVSTTEFPSDKKPPLGLYWYTARTFADFVIRLEYKLDGTNTNSGVIMRFPTPGDNPGTVQSQRQEVQIFGGDPTDKPTGTLYGFQEPTSVPQKPVDQWNDMEITAIGQKYTVKLNGQVINEYTGNRNLSGYIGLQVHSLGKTQFRNVRIKDLSTPQATLAGGGSSSAAAKSPGVTTYKEDVPQIKVLSEQSVNVTGWITAPLNVAVPEAIWENLNFLKESLKDEAALKPAANAASYALGVQLCLKMLENLEARDKAVARSGGAAVLHQKSNLTQYQRDHLTWPQYALERDERAERKDNASNAVTFGAVTPAEWAARSAVMRKEIESLYSRFREAMRQPVK